MGDELLARARRVMPGGVSSPVRALLAVGGEPALIEHGRGAHITDHARTTFIDMVCSFGPLILGHADPQVVDAISHAARAGTSFGATTAPEVELAEAIVEAVDSVDMVRFTTSGTEAAMSAVRLARAATGRDGIVTFAGCYHGHADAMLARAGSAVAATSDPGSPGVPAATAAMTHVLSYNDPGAPERIERAGTSIAAVLVEPIAANMGVVPPEAGWLEALRAACDRTGALLIFDEVVTGFRVGRGGAQTMFGVRPDLTVLGKIIGGGMPVGAYGGHADLMRQIAPAGPVFQAGTLAGNPIAAAAGLATLRRLDAAAYARLDDAGAALQAGIADAAKRAAVVVQISRVGSMLSLAFSDVPVRDEVGARAQDTVAFARFFHAMRARRVWWPPSSMETAFVSLAHTTADIDRVVAAAADALKEIA